MSSGAGLRGHAKLDRSTIYLVRLRHPSRSGRMFDGLLPRHGATRRRPGADHRLPVRDRRRAVSSSCSTSSRHVLVADAVERRRSGSRSSAASASSWGSSPGSSALPATSSSWSTTSMCRAARRECARSASLLPASWLCIAAGGGDGPRGTAGADDRDARVAGPRKRAGLSVRESRVLTIAGMAAGFTVLFGAPLGQRSSRSKCCTGAVCSTTRRLLRRCSARSPATSVYVRRHPSWASRPIWHLPVARRDPLVSDLGWALAAGDWRRTRRGGVHVL